MQKPALLHYCVLLVIGASWGLTTPLSKIAVSSGHGPIGLVFWQLVIGAALMAGPSFARGGGWLINRRALVVCVVLALTGTVIPDVAYFSAMRHLPAGVMAILLSLIPIIAFPMALGLGLERFSLLRFAGITVGLTGMLLMVLPKASLPGVALLAWIPLALIAPISYAFETNYVAKWGLAGLSPVQVMFGVSLVGAVIALPLALATGQFINPVRVWGAPEWALLVTSAIHAVVYAGYVWLVGRAGAVFAVQVSYLVTGFGVVWAMALLGESYSGYVWAALALVLVGVFLVQPQREGREPALVPGAKERQDKT